MDLTWTIEYAVQTGRAQIVSFEWLFPLTKFGVAESGIDYRVFGVVTIILTLMSIVSWLSVAVTDI